MAKKYNKREAKNITNVMANDLFSPFKVQNWINKNMDQVTETGNTIRGILANHGFTRKKLQLTDMFQFEGKVCTLERYCKVADFDPVTFWLEQVPDCGYLYVSSVCVPHELVKIGAYYYKAVPAANNVFAFLQSLDAVTMIREEHERRASQVEDLLYKKEEKERKAAEREAERAAKKEGKAAKKEAGKAKKERNEQIYEDMKILANIPNFSNLSRLQLARLALTSYYRRKAA